MKAIWHFEDDQHEQQIKDTLIDLLANNALNTYSDDIIESMLEYYEVGLLLAPKESKKKN